MVMTIVFSDVHGTVHSVPKENIDELFSKKDFLLGDTFYVSVRGKVYRVSEYEYNRMYDLF
jgi:hypothetical protein